MKNRATLMLNIIMMFMVIITGCSNSNKVNVQDRTISTNDILDTVDYLMGIRYNGVDTLDVDMLDKVILERTLEDIAGDFSREIDRYIDIEYEYQDAESKFNSYKERVSSDYQQPLEVTKPKVNGEEIIDYIEGDVGEGIEDLTNLLNDMYDADGEKVWEGLEVERLDDITQEQIEEYSRVRRIALESFDKVSSEYEANEAERERIESERQRESELPEQSESDTKNIKIDMKDFETSDIIKVLNGQHVIDIADIDAYEESINIKIYGMDYMIDTSEIEKPYDYCLGDDLYNLQRTYHARYDTNVIYITYVGLNKVTNKMIDVTLEFDIVGDKISIDDITPITTTSW